jgi:phospholipid-binding lipoprotein MlaA
MRREVFRLFSLSMIVLAGLGLSGCSTIIVSSVSDNNGEIHDPLESINRGTFAVNDALDRAVARPVAKSYRAAVPSGIRIGLHNLLVHLKSPITLANEILQGDVEGVGRVTFRAVVNTFAGFGGLVDVASWEGIEHEPEDFGQTLAVWGLDHGPYLVLPFMGPSSFRDATGRVVDTLGDPLRLYLFNTNQEEWYYARVGVNAVDKREELIEALDDLRRNSFDYYAAMRSAYYQRRQALVNDESFDVMSAPDIPDYDDE